MLLASNVVNDPVEGVEFPIGVLLIATAVKLPTLVI